MPPPNSPSPLLDGRASWERLRKSCDACQEAKVKCSQQKPSCHRCSRHRQPCVYSPQRRIGRPRKRVSTTDRAGADGGAGGLEERGAGPGETRGDPRDLTLLGDGRDPQLVPADITSNSSESNHPPSLDALFTPSVFMPDSSTASTAQPPLNPTALPSPLDILGDLTQFPSDCDFFVPSPAQFLDTDRPPLLGVDGLNGSSDGGDCGAKCYMMLLRPLLFLRQSLPERARPSIDVILQSEREVRDLLDRVLGCSGCASNPSTVLLLAAVAERIVQMLDWIIEEKAIMDTENARSSRRALGFWARKPSFLPNRGTGRRRNACRIPLRIGQTNLDEDTKQFFLKQLLLMRLKKLTIKLQDLRRPTMIRPGDCIYRAAELVLAGSLQRLEYLRGQVRLWE
ncbi:hypothetical protein VTN00DRAFT_6322 [Thermoascus crustaceus]|uniref:uncharacterized protein n=1 Tax=Thermoascus crustaceus TaxID=5088 RepID=UPI003744655E